MLRNGFVKKSVGTLTLGEKLKKFRDERRVSLSDISRLTKIPLKYLEYLDKGIYEKLPADVYVKGFLKNYAELLGVDEHILIRLFEKEKGINKNLREKNGNGEEKKKPVNISSFVVTPKVIATSAILFLILIGVVYLYREFGSFSNNPRLVILSPEKNYSTNGNSVVIEGVTDTDGKIFINNQPVLVDENGKFRENLTVQSGTSAINVRAVNKFEKETLETLTIQSTFQEPVVENKPEENKNVISENKGVKIEVRVDPGPVWLSVETDGNLVFSGTMLTGATQSFSGDNKIVVNSGSGKATFLKLNGQDIGALSQDPGAVRGVTFTPDTKY